MALITLSERGEELATGQAGKGEAQQRLSQWLTSERAPAFLRSTGVGSGEGALNKV